jgi:hypothetical protein
VETTSPVAKNPTHFKKGLALISWDHHKFLPTGLGLDVPSASWEITMPLQVPIAEEADPRSP